MADNANALLPALKKIRDARDRNAEHGDLFKAYHRDGQLDQDKVPDLDHLVAVVEQIAADQA